MPSHHHRASSSLRQSNKKNKRTKSSKRSLERKNNGRVSLKSTKSSPSSSLSKASRLSKEARINRAKQLRSNKKDELLSRRRGILGSSSSRSSSGRNPPMIVGVLSLSENKDTSEEEMIKKLTSYGEMTEVTGASPTNGGICRFTNVNKLCCRFYSHSRTIVGRSSENDASVPSAVTSALSLSLVCHSLLLLVDDAGTDDRGDYITPLGEAMLTALKAQGLPGTVHVVARSSSSLGQGKKTKGSGAKYLQRMMTAEFGDNLKFFEYEPPQQQSPNDDNDNDDMMKCDNDNTVKRDRANDARLSLLLRSLSLPQCPPKCLSRVPRSYLASEGGCSYDKDKERLVLTGYIRNAPLDVTTLLHVMDVGTFRAEMVERVIDGRVWTNNEDELEAAEVCFANPDALEGEQNLIGFDEHDDIDEGNDDDLRSTTTPNPPAVMDHASAWLNELDPDNNDALSSSRALSDAFNKKSEADSTTLATMDDMDEDADDDKEEERREKALREEQTFPDEVELRRDELGRDRYARYRSLKSFRKSFWDPMENLPQDYGKMFHFENFRGTRRDVMAMAEEVRKKMDEIEENEGQAETSNEDQMEEENDEDDDDMKRLKKDYVPQNTLVRITLKISPHRLQNHPIITSSTKTSSDSPPFLVSAVSLLPHENKASVLHVNLSPLSDAPIVKSKDILTFRMGGFRSFRAKPIFSQSNLNCDKHKFEKFLPPHSHSFLTASLYGPVTFSPVCPVLVFSSDDKLIATGTLSNVDARRIIIKRAILTGYPTRVRKRYATVKYMFYNPEDVKWFRPAGLSTKHGCKGHILESVGDHGTMKCLFDRPVQQHDTVCLPLYKRVFPKFVEGDGEKGMAVW